MIPKLYKVISGKYVDDTLNYLLAHQGGGASVNTFTQNIVLTGNTIPLDTGFYNTGNYGLYVGSQTPQNLIFGSEEIIYVDTSTLTIVGSLVSISYDLIESIWTIQDNQKIENELTNNRDKIPTSQAVYSALGNKQNTLIAGPGISIVDNVISATGGGGGVTVTPLTQNVILEANSSTTGLTTGFYYTNGYGVYYHSATIGNLIYGNGIFYYDNSELTFIDSYNITNYSLGDTDWIVTNNASVESTLTNSTIHVPNSYAVSQAIAPQIGCFSFTQGNDIDINVTTAWTYYKLPLTYEVNNIGNSFSFNSSTNEITIGENVSKVKVDMICYHFSRNATTEISVYKNGTRLAPAIADKQNSDTTPSTAAANQIFVCSTQSIIIDVQENDVITFGLRGSATGHYYLKDLSSFTLTKIK